MKKEKYRVYVYNYQCGFEKYITNTKEEAYNLIENLDPYEYSQYILIKQLPDRDEPFDYGFIAKPNIKKLKRKGKDRR